MVRSPLTAAQPRLLLVQARSAPDMEQQEQECFFERCRLPPSQFLILNVARGDVPDPAVLSEVDVVLIGGAGKYSATREYPWMEGLLALINEGVEAGLPTFGSCWGHQIIARALGGRVEHDPDRAELGCRWVGLTDAGAADPLFRRFSDRFKANMGHHDRVVDLPPGAIELARNEQSNQAFRLRGAPVYGTQFHSELDAQREKERILAYREYYRQALPDDESVQSVIDDLAETTDVDTLLYDFLVTYVVRADAKNGTATLTAERDLDRIPPDDRRRAAA
ncbi:MAG: type 1 glutamine amidotransferase [Salinibacter sp.]